MSQLVRKVATRLRNPNGLTLSALTAAIWQSSGGYYAADGTIGFRSPGVFEFTGSSALTLLQATAGTDQNIHLSTSQGATSTADSVRAGPATDPSVARNLFAVGVGLTGSFAVRGLRVYQDASDRGYLIMGAPDAAVADAALSASQGAWYVSEAGNTVNFKVKYADGTTVKTLTTPLPLS